MHPRAHADLPRLAAHPTASSRAHYTASSHAHPTASSHAHYTASSHAHLTGTSFRVDAAPLPARTPGHTSFLTSRPTAGPQLTPSPRSLLASRPTADPHLTSTSSRLVSRSLALVCLLRFVLALAFPLVVLTALPAAAKCMLPGPALTPGAGTVPAKPVLRLLMPARGAPDGLPRVIARLAGKQVPVTVTADTAAGDLRAYRVVVTAATAGELEISLQNDHGDTTRTWTLAVDPRWRPPASSSAAIAVSRQASRWTCSYQHTRNLRFHGAAAAYRVVLADSAADLTSDRTTSVVVPADTAAFFHAAAPDLPQRDIDLALGHVSCLGHTLEWTRAKHVDIYALWPDGSEQSVTRAPLRLTPP